MNNESKSYAAQLTAEQEQELKEAFNLFDKDGDGTISAKELVVVMRSIGIQPSEEDVQAMMNEIVPDNDGEIEYPGFVELLAKMLSETADKDELQEAFSNFDKGAKGYYTLEDLKMIVYEFGERMTDEEIEKMFQDHDTEKKGKISYEQFVSLFSAHF